MPIYVSLSLARVHVCVCSCLCAYACVSVSVRAYASVCFCVPSNDTVCTCVLVCGCLWVNLELDCHGCGGRMENKIGGGGGGVRFRCQQRGCGRELCASCVKNKQVSSQSCIVLCALPSLTCNKLKSLPSIRLLFFSNTYTCRHPALPRPSTTASPLVSSPSPAIPLTLYQPKELKALIAQASSAAKPESKSKSDAWPFSRPVWPTKESNSASPTKRAKLDAARNVGGNESCWIENPPGKTGREMAKNQTI